MGTILGSRFKIRMGVNKGKFINCYKNLKKSCVSLINNLNGFEQFYSFGSGTLVSFGNYQ
jgi:hypothetical protein